MEAEVTKRGRDGAQVLEERTPAPDIDPRAYPNYFHKVSFHNIFVI